MLMMAQIGVGAIATLLVTRLDWGNALPDIAIKKLYALLMTIAGKGFLYGI